MNENFSWITLSSSACWFDGLLFICMCQVWEQWTLILLGLFLTRKSQLADDHFPICLCERNVRSWTEKAIQTCSIDKLDLEQVREREGVRNETMNEKGEKDWSIRHVQGRQASDTSQGRVFLAWFSETFDRSSLTYTPSLPLPPPPRCLHLHHRWSHSNRRLLHPHYESYLILKEKLDRGMKKERHPLLWSCL